MRISDGSVPNMRFFGPSSRIEIAPASEPLASAKASFVPRPNDGAQLAWMGSRIGDMPTAIVIADSVGAHARVLEVGPIQSAAIVWSPDAREILAFSPGSDHTARVLIVDVTGQTPPISMPAPHGDSFSWQWLPR